MLHPKDLYWPEYLMRCDGTQKLAESGKIGLNKIPFRYLARYLGMRLETLSRVRSKELHKTENRGVPVSIEE
ncbi:hypothetical protein [Pedobacter borealis]|uniref:hypothetical protein n=1 Tax=Pedobacter borealis TaxID=475254 RepID=UPI0004937958|nr:hypothetical protein [Pedobacter borealis]